MILLIKCVNMDCGLSGMSTVVISRILSIRMTSHVHSPKEQLMPPTIRCLGRSNSHKSSLNCAVIRLGSMENV